MKALCTWLRAALLLGAFGLAACGGGAGQGQGVVTAVDPDRAQVTIDHGEIPGLMKAMTMTFPVDDPSLLTRVRAGDRVRFRVVYAGGKYSVTSIESQ